MLCHLRKPMRCALISALSMIASRPELQNNVPMPWTSIGLAGMHSAWPTISIPTFPPGKILSPCSKSSVKDIEMDACPPRHKPIKARTVEDGPRAVGQAHTRLGGPDPRKDSNGSIDFRIQRQIKAHNEDNVPPKRVIPVPIIIIMFIAAQAFGDTHPEEEMAIANMITIAFFFLLRPGEYTGTLSDDAAFKMQDVGLYIQDCKLDLFYGEHHQSQISHLHILHLYHPEKW
jgi:hypothetical protein